MKKDEKSEQIRQARNAYLREWRSKNPDKVKAINDRYWAKRAEKIMGGKHHAENPHDR